MDASREFEKALRQIEKRVEEMEAFSRSMNIDLSSSIKALRAQLENLRKSVRPAAAGR